MNLDEFVSLKEKKILCCTTEPGAGLFIAPLIKEMEKNNEVDVFASENSLPPYDLRGVKAKSIRTSNGDQVTADFLLKKKYDLLLVGTNIGPGLEKDLTLSAQNLKIPSLAFVDHYWHPWQRFADMERKVKNKFLADHVWVIDDWVKKRLVENQVPALIISTVAHPHLQQLKRNCFDRKKIRQRLCVSEKVNIVTFASEPPPNVLYEWGNESPSAEDIRNAIRLLSQSVNKLYKRQNSFMVLIKKHPKEATDFMSDEFQRIECPYKIVESFPPNDLMSVSSVVLGMGSMFMLESLGLDVPTASLNFNAKMGNRDITDRVGGLFFLGTENAVEEFIEKNLK